MQSSLRQKGQEAEDLQLCQPHFQPRPDYQQSLYKHLRDNRAISSQHSFVWSKSSQTDLIPFLASVTGPAEQLEPHSWTVARFGARSSTTRVLGDQDPGAGGGQQQGFWLWRGGKPHAARVDTVFAQPAPKNNKWRKPVSVGAWPARLTPAAATPG